MPLLEGVAIIIMGSGRRIATGDGAMLVVDAPTPDGPEASGEAIFDPGYWRLAGRAAPAGRGRGAAWFVGDGTREWVLRHYRRGGLVAPVVVDRYCWGGEERVRAFAEWRLLDKLWRRGLPVPRPVAARYRREGPFYRCDLITCRIPGARPLSERLAAGALPLAHWAALGTAVARLHHVGVDHADLNAHNVLIDDHGRVSFIDFDRGRLRSSGDWAERNLRRLRRSLRKLGAEGGGALEVEWRAFMRAYEAAVTAAVPPGARRSSIRPMRSLYRVLIRIAAPLAAALPLGRAIRDPAYREGFSERFGYGRRGAPGAVWLHAVSLGEVGASIAILHALRRRHPELALALTTSTPTGRAKARSAFRESVDVRYLPYDTPGGVARFLDRLRPRVGIVMETELWPTLFEACARRGIPLVLASARLSARSVSRYRRGGALFRDLFTEGVTIAAQTEEDRARFARIGADPARVHVLGNVKFDMRIDEGLVVAARSLRAGDLADRPTWVAGSTHSGEEDAILDAHRRLLRSVPGALLVLAPRHPQRFDAAAALLDGGGWRYERRSARPAAPSDAPVLLLDTIGELPLFYAAGDVAFVGGSLVPIGGHNLLEPAAVGVPVLTGPSIDNGREIAALLIASGAARVVADAAELGTALVRLFADPAERARIGAIGRRTVAAQRGGVDRLLDLLEPLLGPGATATNSGESTGPR